jgi:microcystin-dependent protein
VSSETFLPVATENDLPMSGTAVPLAEAVGALADVLSTDGSDPTQVRIGSITSTADPNTAGRVQVDIAGTSWCSRSADISLRSGDRVCVLQQGPVFIVIARIGASEAHPIGALLDFAGGTAPAGWLLCDGSAVSRTTYAALFSTIGTTYGSGNGTTTFNVPNVLNRMVVGSGSSYTRGQIGGASTVTLTTTTMPSHSHSLSGTASSAGSHSHGGSTGSDAHSHSGDGAVGGRSDLLAGGGTNAATSAGTGSTSSDSHSHSISTDSQGSHGHSLSGSVGSNGSDGAHENMSPFLAMPKIIRAL